MQALMRTSATRCICSPAERTGDNPTKAAITAVSVHKLHEHAVGDSMALPPTYGATPGY
jgi:hypothetical protein